MHDLTDGCSLAVLPQAQDPECSLSLCLLGWRDVALIRVLNAVSVAVRHSLTGDRNVTRALIFIDPGSKGRVLLPLVLSATRCLVNVFGSFRFHSEFQPDLKS